MIDPSPFYLKGTDGYVLYEYARLSGDYLITVITPFTLVDDNKNKTRDKDLFRGSPVYVTLYEEIASPSNSLGFCILDSSMTLELASTFRHTRFISTINVLSYGVIGASFNF
jgi:hypothetical protein